MANTTGQIAIVAKTGCRSEMPVLSLTMALARMYAPVTATRSTAKVTIARISGQWRDEA